MRLIPEVLWRLVGLLRLMGLMGLMLGLGLWLMLGLGLWLMLGLGLWLMLGLGLWLMVGLGGGLVVFYWQEQVYAVGLALDLLVDPGEVDFERARAVGGGAEDAEAAGVGDGRHDVAAVTEGEDREFDPEAVADFGVHGDLPLLTRADTAVLYLRDAGVRQGPRPVPGTSHDAGQLKGE